MDIFDALMRRVVTKKISSYADVNVNINMSRQDNNLSWMRILKIELKQFSLIPSPEYLALFLCYDNPDNFIPFRYRSQVINHRSK